jgi:hypothetical protein
MQPNQMRTKASPTKAKSNENESQPNQPNSTQPTLPNHTQLQPKHSGSDPAWWEHRRNMEGTWGNNLHDRIQNKSGRYIVQNNEG